MTHLIDKSALVAEIERRIREIEEIGTYLSPKGTLTNLLCYINTIEVKRVDLDNEYTEEIYSHLDSIKDTADRMTSGNFMHNRAAIKFSANTIAKVLELMGLKRRKENNYGNN